MDRTAQRLSADSQETRRIDRQLRRHRFGHVRGADSLESLGHRSLAVVVDPDRQAIEGGVGDEQVTVEERELSENGVDHVLAGLGDGEGSRRGREDFRHEQGGIGGGLGRGSHAIDALQVHDGSEWIGRGPRHAWEDEGLGTEAGGEAFGVDDHRDDEAASATGDKGPIALSRAGDPFALRELGERLAGVVGDDERRADRR